MTPFGEEDFRHYIIAQDDDCDYSESGWVACVKDDWAGLASYSHCSCFGTWEAMDGKFSWEGTPEQLVAKAREEHDPIIDGKKASTADYDYDHLMVVYGQILEWAKNNIRM